MIRPEPLSSPPQPLVESATSAASVRPLRSTIVKLRPLALASCALLPGCGGGGDGGSSAPSTLPPCAKVQKEIKRPAGLPADFPVPPGTRFNTVQTPNAGHVIVTGHSPGDPDDVRSFYDEQFEPAGYRAGRTESEAGIEVEGTFTGNGVRGVWRALVLPECEGATYVTLVVIRT